MGAPAAAATLEYNEAVEVGLTDGAHVNVGWTAAYGQSGFDPSGDEIWTWDTAEDGDSVGVAWQTTDGRYGLCRDKLGFNGRWAKCNKNFAESEAIRIKMGHCDASATRSCKLWSHYTWTSAWSNWVSVAG